jgi:alpha-beta hydrolase superfamily lysophospholipase
MQRLALGRLACSIVVGFVMGGWSQTGHTAEPDRVKFDTYDQVEIHGTYFPGDSGNKSPCALLLHALGGSSREEGWDNLAKELQKKHFAVLLFDFRGHGESTTVNMDFWRLDPNSRSLKGYKPGKLKDQISYKDFTTQLNWLSLVNDIEAAKRFLDRKNDGGECNSGNLTVIGAESSAALGLLWIAMQWAPEWQRFRNAPVLSPLAVNRNQIGGQDISCAVWLSFSPQIAVDRAKFTLHPDSWLASPVREKVPLYFLYGEQDSKAKSTALHLYDNVLHARKDKKLKLTAEKAIKNTKLAGRELLASPDTMELVPAYVSKVLEDRGFNLWSKRDVDRTLPVRVPIERFIR